MHNVIHTCFFGVIQERLALPQHINGIASYDKQSVDASKGRQVSAFVIQIQDDRSNPSGREDKRIDPPTKQAPLIPAEPTAAETLATMAQDLKAQNPVPTPHTPRQHDERIPSHDELHEMKKTAAQGVVIVAVPQLFPTPPELADRMVELADIRPGQQVLEPSAGTGRIIDAIRRNAHGCAITAVELNCNIAHRLRTVECVDDTRQADFLDCNGDLGTLDRIVMNPPFANADDIKHIMHALKMLKPGGRLVAICANGPRQNDTLRPLVEARGGIWEELPSDTFIGAGTSVRTVLLMLDALPR
jgi:phospholipid N-methyltransferase